jgi:hypothetical protein
MTPAPPYAPQPGDNVPPRTPRARAAAKAGKVHRRASAPRQEDKRVIFGGAIIVVVFGISFAGCGGSSFSHSTRAVPGTPCAISYIGKRDSDVCADASGTVTVDNLTVSATPLAATGDGSGGISLCSNVTLTNSSGDSQDYDALDFKIQNPSGDLEPPSSLGISGTLHAGTLAPGGTKTGKVCDDKPERKGLYALIYKPSSFGAQRGVWLSQH